MTLWLFLLALCLLGGLEAEAAPATPHQFDITRYLAAAPQNVFYLPRGLTEISGVAVASSNTVFAHDDEYGIVYEVSLATGKIVRAFALGKPTVHEDFEDIADTADRVYLLTSDGVIFEALKGAHRKRVLFDTYDTGVGRACETEGLITWQDDSFLILCKTMRKDDLINHLVIYRWSLKDRMPATPWLNVSLDGILKRKAQQNFHPSAFVWRRETQTFAIVSAKDRILIEIDRKGHLVSHCKLTKASHPQAEGITEMPDGRLVISDEGKQGLGRISVYAVPRGR
jgi:SdiA-regulated